MEDGLDPAQSQNSSAITGAPVTCYAPLARLRHILVEIGQAIDEHHPFVMVIRAADLDESHALK
jgi:hypothetical protein